MGKFRLIHAFSRVDLPRILAVTSLTGIDDCTTSPTNLYHWQVSAWNPGPTIGKQCHLHRFLRTNGSQTARSQWMAKPNVQFFTDSLQHLCLCRRESSPRGWMRIANTALLLMCMQLATNSIGLRLVRGFETSFKHLNHQSHVQLEKKHDSFLQNNAIDIFKRQ